MSFVCILLTRIIINFGGNPFSILNLKKSSSKVIMVKLFKRAKFQIWRSVGLIPRPISFTRTDSGKSVINFLFNRHQRFASNNNFILMHY